MATSVEFNEQLQASAGYATVLADQKALRSLILDVSRRQRRESAEQHRAVMAQLEALNTNPAIQIGHAMRHGSRIVIGVLGVAVSLVIVLANLPAILTLLQVWHHR